MASSGTPKKKDITGIKPRSLKGYANVLSFGKRWVRYSQISTRSRDKAITESLKDDSWKRPAAAARCKSCVCYREINGQCRGRETGDMSTYHMAHA
jgi:hypothetical protein